MNHPKLCKVCYGECDPEIHESTLAIRAWFRERVEYSLMPVEIGKVKNPKT